MDLQGLMEQTIAHSNEEDLAVLEGADEDASSQSVLCLEQKASVFGVLERWLGLNDDKRVPFDHFTSVHHGLTEDVLLSLSAWRVSAACRITWALVRRLVLSSLFVSVARGHMGDIDAIVRDVRLHVLFVDDDNGLFSDEDEEDEILSFTGFNKWSYTGTGSFSEAFIRDRRFFPFARSYNKSAIYLRRTPVAYMDYLAAVVDYALFLQNSELRCTYLEYGEAPSAENWDWQMITALPCVPSAEMRQSRPYLDSLRKLGLANDLYSKPACLAALRNAQSSVPAASGSKIFRLEVWPLAPPVRLSERFAEDKSHALPNPGKATFRFELDLYNSTCYEGWSGFRVLCIQPGRPSSPLHINLCASALPAGVKYIAISYAWPADLFTSVGYMDCASGRTEFLTSTHVEAVLKRLRLEHDYRYVWIDSICINQANLTERSHQVAKMRSIYGRATSVFVWLGQPEVSAKVNDSANASLEETLWSCLAGAGDAVWWKRLWILQETAVAKRVEVGFGAYSLSWAELMSELEAVTLHAAVNAIDGGLEVNYPDAPHDNQRVLAAADRLRTIDVLRQSVTSRQGSFVGLSMHNLLQQSTAMAVSLPLDRVYSLLGLLSSTALSIEPDYLAPVELLYLETLLHIIDGDHSLDILTDGWPPLSRVDISWSKDFARPRKLLGSMAKLGYSAGSRKRAECSVWRSGSTSPNAAAVRSSIIEWHNVHLRVASRLELHVCGLRVDSIARVHSGIKKPRVFEMHSLVTQSDLVSLKKELVVQLAEAMMRNGSRCFPHGDARSALNDIFGATQNTAHRPDDEGPEALLSAWWEALCTATDDGTPETLIEAAAEKLSTKQAIALQEIVADRVYFCTSHGLVGLAPAGVQRRDVIVVAFGASTPFVLRPVGDAYTLVGDAYVHGVMHGEMMKLHAERATDIPVETFVLI